MDTIMVYLSPEQTRPHRVSLAEGGMGLQSLARVVEVEHTLELEAGNVLGVIRGDTTTEHYRLVSKDAFAMEQAACPKIVASFALRDLRGLQFPKQ